MASMSLSFYSSLVCSPLTHNSNSNKQTGHRVVRFYVVRCASIASTTKTSTSSSSSKKKHWKEGEYPGVSESWFGGSKKTPIKNVKKKLDKKTKSKAWVSTVTETLSDLILKKNWLEALQVNFTS